MRPLGGVVVTMCGIVVAAVVVMIVILWYTSADVMKRWRIK